MNYILKYYYDINNPQLSFHSEKIHVRKDNERFILQETENIQVVDDIVNLLAENNLNSKYYEIVKTRYGKNYVQYKNKNYVLLRVTKTEHNNIFVNKHPIIINGVKYKDLYRINWYFLWSNKNDNLYNFFSEKEKNSIENELFYYFMGIAETAIAYIMKTKNKNKAQYMYISHNRINEQEFNNPLNIVLDNKERDVAEMIKYTYFSQEDYAEKIDNILEMALKEDLSFEIIFARVLYPTHFFDYIENINKGYLKEKKYFLNKFYNYENFLKIVYKKISLKKQIKKIDWL